jgi:hypothetical protein
VQEIRHKISDVPTFSLAAAPYDGHIVSTAAVPCVQTVAGRVISAGGVDMEPLGGRRDLVLPTLEKVW